jgi:prophage antirepressor-like protein
MAATPNLDRLLDEEDRKEASARETGIVDLVTLFENENVRIFGTADEPLFMIADVSKVLGDVHDHYNRFFDHSRKDVDYVVRRFPDKRGHRRDLKLLTEKGLYRYIMRLETLEAEQFQDYILDKIKEIRKSVVDRLKLETKIARQVAESIRQKINVVEEKNFFLENLYNQDYVKEPDHEPEQMAEHYIQMFIYEYKHIFPKMSSKINNNVWKLPADFNREKINPDHIDAIHLAAERFFPKNDCANMQRFVYNVLKANYCVKRDD